MRWKRANELIWRPCSSEERRDIAKFEPKEFNSENSKRNQTRRFEDLKRQQWRRDLGDRMIIFAISNVQCAHFVSVSFSGEAILLGER